MAVNGPVIQTYPGVHSTSTVSNAIYCKLNAVKRKVLQLKQQILNIIATDDLKNNYYFTRKGKTICSAVQLADITTGL